RSPRLINSINIPIKIIVHNIPGGKKNKACQVTKQNRLTRNVGRGDYFPNNNSKPLHNGIRQAHHENQSSDRRNSPHTSFPSKNIVALRKKFYKESISIA